MKLNKLIVLTSLAAGSMVALSPAFGQNTPNPATPNPATPNPTTPMTPRTPMTSQASGASRIDRLSQELNLSDTQKQKVQSIFDSERQQMRDVHQDTTMSTGEKRSKMVEVRDSLNTKLKSVLTPEQYTKWQNLTHQTHAMQPMQQPMQPNTPPGGKP